MRFLLVLIGLLPASRTKNALLSWCGKGWRVASSARIQPVVLWQVRQLHVGNDSRIGAANVFRDLLVVQLDDEAVIGQLNWFTAEARYAAQDHPEFAGRLVLERGAAIASRHYVDCAGGFRMGAISILAGVRSTVLTHWAEHRNWVLRAAPVKIGAGSIVSSRVTLTAGASVPDGCVVAAGAVVAKPLTQPETLYGGVPAKPIGDLEGSAHARRASPHFARVDPDDSRLLAENSPGATAVTSRAPLNAGGKIS